VEGMGGKPEDGAKHVENNKGCDFGYAPVANSCEGVNNPDACTVTASDAITAFAVLNPNCSSQSASVFSGPSVLVNHFTGPNHPAYFGSATVY
jgi:hypothetical protein